MSQIPERPSELPISDEDWANTPTNVQGFILSQVQPSQQAADLQQGRSSKRRSIIRFSSLMLIIIFTGIAALILVSLLVSGAQTCILRGGQTYKVQSGDTLYGLSIRFGIPVSTIAAANGIDDANFLYVHQDIVMPQSYCAPAYIMKDALAVEANLTSDWLTLRPTATPTTDLTKTTATVTPPIDPIHVTATYIVRRATETMAAYQTVTAAANP